jgi:hypothetical protein
MDLEQNDYFDYIINLQESLSNEIFDNPSFDEEILDVIKNY